ncbi:MAG: hypothetical protein ACOVQG_03160 [Crocinitomicaceae bacterium]|jgi:hypothetical protein
MSTTNSYSFENTPLFLLNHEFFSIAWGQKHFGYFVDPINGYFIEYQNPVNWNFFSSAKNEKNSVFWGHETDGFIMRKDLFQNINQLKITTIKQESVEFNLSEILNDIIKSGYDQVGGGCDMGISSYTILIYDIYKDLYTRNILNTDGDLCLRSRSLFANELMRYFHL